MTKDRPKNVAASVRQRLLNLARERGEDFQLVLSRFAAERLLYRLSRSRHRSEFILKGALLFQLWGETAHRPTRDIDLLGHGKSAPAFVAEIFREICTVEVESDGLRFVANSVTAQQIKPGEEYQGVRLELICQLENARIKLQIDVGYGDVVTPPASEVVYPVALDFPAPVLKAYPKETVVAEKLQAMVALGIANSRMKDFYDVRHLAERFTFDGTVLAEAIAKTFERRATAIPRGPPICFSDDFANDPQKRTQWTAFVKKGKLAHAGVGLANVVVELREFLSPVLDALANSEQFARTWPAGGPWAT